MRLTRFGTKFLLRFTNWSKCPAWVTPAMIWPQNRSAFGQCEITSLSIGARSALLRLCASSTARVTWERFSPELALNQKSDDQNHCHCLGKNCASPLLILILIYSYPFRKRL